MRAGAGEGENERFEGRWDCFIIAIGNLQIHFLQKIELAKTKKGWIYQDQGL